MEGQAPRPALGQVHQWVLALAQGGKIGTRASNSGGVLDGTMVSSSGVLGGMTSGIHTGTMTNVSLVGVVVEGVITAIGVGVGVGAGVGVGVGVGVVAAMIFPVVLETLGAQQEFGKAKLSTFAPARVKPVNVTGVVPRLAVESKFPVPTPTSVTPVGVTPEVSAFNNPVKVTVVEPPWIWFCTSGYTSMCCNSGEATKVNLPEAK